MTYVGRFGILSGVAIPWFDGRGEHLRTVGTRCNAIPVGSPLPQRLEET